MAINSDLLRGHTETIILHILTQGDSYGYEISRIIHDNSKGLFDIKDATIYTAFRRLEENEFISTYWGDGVGGARRRYYTITKTGKHELKIRIAEWKKAEEVINRLIGG